MTAVGLTSIKTIILPGGGTSHSMFRLPVPLFESPVSVIISNSTHEELLLNVGIVIWDDAFVDKNRLSLS
jgi:hypothetical protein